MHGYRLRKQVRGWLRDLGVRPPLTVPDLCARLTEYRERPLRLLPHQYPVPGLSGAWVSTDRADYIPVQSRTSPGHQEHLILHGIGHLLVGHPTGTPDDRILLLLPDLPGLTIRVTPCGLGDRTGPGEEDAEEIAALISQWAAQLNEYADRMPAGLAGVQLARGLTDHMGWL